MKFHLHIGLIGDEKLIKTLDQISINGYKSIQELNNFPLKSLNILIGANGAGKTNFISFFTLLNEIVKNRLQLFVGQAGGADALLYFGQKSTPEITAKLVFGRNSYSFTLIPAAGDRLIFADEKMTWFVREYYEKPYEVSLGEGHRETRLYEEYDEHGLGSISEHILDTLISWQVYHFHDTSSSSKVKQNCKINDNKNLFPDASNLAAYLYLLQETKKDYYRQIVSTIRLVAPFFDDFSLRLDPLNPEMIRLEWKETGTDTYFNAHALSDGTLRFICLATLLLQPDLPSMIIIDEPELGLHPYAITMLASLLKSASQKTQILVSTQSVPLVNQFAPEDIIVVDRENNQSTFRRLSENELGFWLDEYDYGMGDLWEKNLLGGRPE